MGSGYLILADGQVFEGQRFGAQPGFLCGELVFTTGMTGYLQTLTDPSHYGQMVIQTFPMIGNYGVIPDEFESERPHLSAYIVHEVCEAPSNFRSEGRLDEWLESQGVPGLLGVDTRRLTRIVREEGVMNAALSATPTLSEAQWQALRGYAIGGAVEAVTCKQSHTVGEGPLRVVLYDFGVKANIRGKLARRGCQVVTVPASTPADEVLALRPQGIVFSNGPGDPAENAGIIRQIRTLFDSGVPLMGICLGHQLMALAHGARTRKMKYGHRGANQPAQHLETGRVYITSQNHGYCVVGDSLPDGVRPMFVNANDGTNEGLIYSRFPGFSVQFHPEAHAGPQDTGFLFDRFVSMMQEVNAYAAG
ncbi:MAG: carbamoyl phosphate synthase small subunit [Oscillospiraceae bacterium]